MFYEGHLNRLPRQQPLIIIFIGTFTPPREFHVETSKNLKKNIWLFTIILHGWHSKVISSIIFLCGIHSA